MKHSDADLRTDARSKGEESALLIRLAGECNVTVSVDEALAMIGHLDLVLEHNTRLNLTRITQRRDALLGHVIDSLAAVPHLIALGADDKVADIGSGAGYPGIPLAITVQAAMTLVESIQKKAEFLQEVAISMADAANVEVYAGRAEELAVTSGGSFASVTARAVTGLPSLVELASPLLRHGGTLVALKGAPDPTELAAGAAAANLVGMEEVERKEYHLPVLGHRRMIVIYSRTGDPSRDLPRRPGIAQKRPLA